MSKDRHRAQDYVDLLAAANRAISSALADGDRAPAEPQAEPSNPSEAKRNEQTSLRGAFLKQESAACVSHQPKHPPGSWMKETVEEQLKHIEAHITQYQCGDRSENHLAHIACRAAIAAALAEQKSDDPRLDPPPVHGEGGGERAGSSYDRCSCWRQFEESLRRG